MRLKTNDSKNKFNYIYKNKFNYIYKSNAELPPNYKISYPLHYAVINNNHSLLYLLIETLSFFDHFDMLDCNFCTPLDYAKDKQYLKKILLKYISISSEIHALSKYTAEIFKNSP